MLSLRRLFALSIAFALGGCDCGTQPTVVPLLAVGSHGQVSFLDTCAGNQPIDRGAYWHCTDDSVTGFDSVAIEGPFEITSQTSPTVAFTAVDAGLGTLTVVAAERTGKTERFEVKIEAAEIAHVKSGPVCLPGASSTFLEAGAFFSFATTATDDQARLLSTVGIDDLVQLDGSVHFYDAGALQGFTVVEDAGDELWLTSAHDPGLQLHYRVVAPADLSLLTVKSKPPGKGLALLQAVPVADGGTRICELAPLHRWAAHVDTPEVCLLRDTPDGGLAFSAAQAGVDGMLPPIGSSAVLPEFQLFVLDAGTCVLQVSADGISGTLQAELP